MTAPDAAVLARYAGAYYAGAPALVRTPHGAGAAYYYGAAFDTVVAGVLIDRCGLRSPAEGVMALPREVELCIRARPAMAESFWFLLNYAPETREVILHEDGRDLLTGERVAGRFAMNPYGVAVLLR